MLAYTCQMARNEWVAMPVVNITFSWPGSRVEYIYSAFISVARCLFTFMVMFNKPFKCCVFVGLFIGQYHFGVHRDIFQFDKRYF
jgi:hypothetical protein